MRVLHVISEMAIGGAETLVAELVRAGGERGWTSAVASGGGPRAEELVRDGLAVTFDVPPARRRPWGVVQAARHTRRAVHAFAPDVVLAHNVGASVVSTLATRRGRVAPVVTTFHGVGHHEYRRAAWILDRTGDELAAVSDAVVARLRAVGLRRTVTVIPPAVPVPPRVPAEPVRTELGLPTGAPVVLCVARLVRSKRHDVLLEAWASTRPDAVLLVAGDGPERDVLRQRARRLGVDGRIRWLGTRDDVPALLSVADVVVLASDWEAMPVALLEAMGAGIPVVASDVDGMRELLAAGGGVLVPARRPTALAAALEAMLADPRARAREGERAALTVAERHAPGAMLDGYDRLLRRVLEVPRVGVGR